MAANRFAVVWFCSLAKNRITAENGRFENIHSCWPHWSHISSKKTEKVREIYWKVSGNRCSYLPQIPLTLPKRQTLRPTTCLTHGVQKYAVLTWFSSRRCTQRPLRKVWSIPQDVESRVGGWISIIWLWIGVLLMTPQWILAGSTFKQDFEWRERQIRFSLDYRPKIN